MEKGGSALQILRGSSLPQVVQEEIQRMILEGEFEPGEKLGEVELAMRLGVSRGPVREAFRGLEEVGLISFAKNRGVFIRQHSIEEIRELYIVRAGLEEMIGRLLTPKITKPEIKELYDYIERMENSYSYNGARGYFDLNMKFHDRIAEIAGNQKLLEVYRRLANETLLVRQRSLSLGGNFLASSKEHRAIVESLASRDSFLAARTISDHVKNGLERLIELMQSRTAPNAKASMPAGAPGKSIA